MLLGSEEPNEKFGDVNIGVFPCGWIIDEPTGMVCMHYSSNTDYLPKPMVPMMTKPLLERNMLKLK